MLRCGSFWVFCSFLCSFRSLTGQSAKFRFTICPVLDYLEVIRPLIPPRFPILEQLYHLCPCPVFPDQLYSQDLGGRTCHRLRGRRASRLHTAGDTKNSR